MRILAYCLMPNHWHLLLWPERDGQLSAYMHWLETSHADHWRRVTHSRGEGAVYQARFTSVPILDPVHFYTAWRYIERNPIEAGLVKRAEEWDWSSASHPRVGCEYLALDPGPLQLSPQWLAIVNEEGTLSEVIPRLESTLAL